VTDVPVFRLLVAAHPGVVDAPLGRHAARLRVQRRVVSHAGMVTEPVGGPGRSTPFGEERDPSRIVAFSDAVIAIAVTLLVLEIRPPQDAGRLVQGLTALWPSYMAYGLTFMLIGQVWANHHVMFDHIRSADRMVLFLNTVLLMDIAAASLPPRWPARADRSVASPPGTVGRRG
jgi:Endosomal/lysosomal potassium channel TMEM175